MKRINIKDKNAIEKIAVYKNKKYQNTDIELQNTKLKELNKKLVYPVFYKNNLYVNSGTLYELMLPEGGKDKHNYHGLTPKMIVDSLLSLKDTIAVFESNNNRYIVVTGVLKDGYTIIAIIETGAPILENHNANINKLITMYPKDKINSKYTKLNKK